MEFSQALIVHSGFLDDPEHSKVRHDLWFACRELGQLLTVFAAQDSSGSANHEADASRWARELVDYLGPRDGRVGFFGNQITDVRSKIDGD